MNRSLTRRAVRAYDATVNRRGGAELNVAVVFPDGAFDPLPEHWSPGEGFRPFGWGLWLRPGPQIGGGTVVAGPIPAWDHKTGARRADETWTVEIIPDGWPSIGTIIDKMHRIRSAADTDSEATVIRVEPSADAPAGQLADRLQAAHGFVPEMDGWLWPGHPYRGRAFLALEWAENSGSGLTFTDFVTILNHLNRAYRARIIFHRPPVTSRDLNRWIRHGGVYRDWDLCRRVLPAIPEPESETSR